MSAHPGADGVPLPPELRPLDGGDPRAIGPYTVVGRLGQGGMGTVFGAVGAEGTCIAVKVVHERFAEDPAFREAFAREVELMRRVRGVYTAAVHAADTEAARPWVATDFVPGTTLRRRVEQEGPLEPDMLLAFAAGTAEALTAIHAAGIAHCDVKPGNVMLSPEGPRVLDFGIARPAGRSAAGRTAGATFGSPGWVSPERYRGAEPGMPADVFAWGCLVAYAATGRPPFGTGDAQDKRRRTLAGDADLAGVPDTLRPVVELAMAADPAARPTAESVYRGLIAFASPDDISRVETRDLTRRLLDVVGSRWRGIDASWHDPRKWLAAARFAGAVGGAALAAGGGAAGVGGAGAGAAGAAGAGAGTGGAGGGAGLAGAAGGAGAAGATGAGGAGAAGGATAGAAAGGLKIGAIAASAVIVVGGLGAGGYFTLDALSSENEPPQEQAAPSPSPTLGTPDEIVAGIVRTVETADSYRAVEATTPTDGLPSQVEHVLSTSGGEPVFQTTTVTGSPESPEFAMDLIYRPEADTLIERTWGPGAPSDDYVASSTAVNEAVRWQNSRAVVLAPLESLADTMEVGGRSEDEVDGTPAVRVTGTFDLDVPNGEFPFEADGLDFSLWAAMDGSPLRLEYELTGDDPLAATEYVWTYGGFDGLDGDLCGAVEGVPSVERALLVPTDDGIDCGEARAVAEEYLAMPDEEKEGSGYVAEVDGWVCGLASTAEVANRLSEAAGTCYQGELGARERVDLVRLH